MSFADAHDCIARMYVRGIIASLPRSPLPSFPWELPCRREGNMQMEEKGEKECKGEKIRE